MADYDAIIIGAGHNGLAAAVHLASKGWRVAVLEAKAEAGGAVKTLELTEPGFRHDLCAMNLSMFAGSPFHAAYGDELRAHGLGFIPAKHCFASVFEDGTHLGVSTDRAETMQAIRDLSGKDSAAWGAMIEDFGKTSPHLFGLLGAPMPSLAAAHTVWNAWRAGGWPLLFDLGRLLLSSPRSFLDRHFENDKVKAMMAAWGLHLDFAPDIAGGALFSYLESMSNQLFGMVIGAGGADTIIHSMASLLKAKGGTLLTSTRVASVLMEGNQARGVVLDDERTLTAAKAVISNVHPKLLFEGMVAKDSRRASFDASLAHYRPGPGAMMIHLSMDDLPDWRASAALREYAYVHIAPDMGMMNRVYAEAKDGLLPTRPALVVGQPTALDPSRAPQGKHVLWVQVRVLPASIRGDAKGEIAAKDWDNAKDAYAERVLDIIEGHAPGFRRKIRQRHILSPIDLERLNANLIGGDSLSGSHHLDQNFLFRPVAGYSRYKTPVPNLYLCGAATWPGAGTGAGSGFMLAKMLAR